MGYVNNISRLEVITVFSKLTDVWLQQHNSRSSLMFGGNALAQVCCLVMRRRYVYL